MLELEELKSKSKTSILKAKALIKQETGLDIVSVVPIHVLRHLLLAKTFS